MNQIPLYQALARKIAWQATPAFKAQRDEEIARLVDMLPSGSGIDDGPTLCEDSTGEKIRLSLSFHHMNDGGMYDGWTDHVVTIHASLAWGFEVSVSGRNRNEIKDYIAEAFDCALRVMVDEHAAVAVA